MTLVSKFIKIISDYYKKKKDSRTFLVIEYIISIWLILVICGVLAYGLSVAFWYYIDSPVSEKSPILENPGWKNWSQNLLETVPEDNSTSSVICDKRLVGYYTDYTRAIVRNEQILNLTHVIYLLLDVYSNGDVKVLDEQKDTSFLKKVEIAKRLNPKLKVMVGVGGYQFTRRFSSVAGDEAKRQTFQDSVTAFLLYHKLDGVDIFWAWPKAEDRDDYLELIKGLRQNLPPQYLISIILPRLAQQLDGYILNSLVDYVDFFNVLSYDYFEPLPGYGTNLGPISPLYGGQRGNVDETMKQLTCETRKPSKLNMGTTLYGTYWNNVESGLGEKRDDIWRLSEVENGPGYSIGWREMEQRNWNLSSANWHEASKSSYIWNPRNKRFLGFENEKSLKEKVIYAKNKNIGGIVVWTMDQDDDKDSVLNIMTSVDMCERGTGDTLNYECSD